MLARVNNFRDLILFYWLDNQSITLCLDFGQRDLNSGFDCVLLRGRVHAIHGASPLMGYRVTRDGKHVCCLICTLANYRCSATGSLRILVAHRWLESICSQRWPDKASMWWSAAHFQWGYGHQVGGTRWSGPSRLIYQMKGSHVHRWNQWYTYIERSRSTEGVSEVWMSMTADDGLDAGKYKRWYTYLGPDMKTLE